MSKLNSSERNALPSKDFVFRQQRKFPINDANHARNALSRAGAKGGSVEAKVRAAVHAKFPGIGKKSSLPPKFQSMMKDEAKRILKN